MRVNIPFFQGAYCVKYAGAEKSLVVRRVAGGFLLAGLARERVPDLGLVNDMANDLSKDYGEVIWHGPLSNFGEASSSIKLGAEKLLQKLDIKL